MKTTKELIMDLNKLRATMKRPDQFSSVQEWVNYNQNEYCPKHAAIMHQIAVVSGGSIVN